MEITVSTDRDKDLPVSPGGQNLTRRASKFTTSKVKRENYGPRVNFYEDMDLLNFLRRDSKHFFTEVSQNKERLRFMKGCPW